MTFAEEWHLLDLDGKPVVIGITAAGEVHLDSAHRLSPDLAARLSDRLNQLARLARGYESRAPRPQREP